MRQITQQQAQLRNQATHVISLTDSFRIDGPTGSHECMALPLLGSDLSRQARRFPKRRIPVSVMKQITRQLLEGLRFLHETCGVIHTGICIQEYGKLWRWLTEADRNVDLQPSNICFELTSAQVAGMYFQAIADFVDILMQTWQAVHQPTKSRQLYRKRILERS